jgi:cytochrome c peroxidase
MIEVRSLLACAATIASALAIAGQPTPLGLPARPTSADPGLESARADLGRKLFMDRRLSPNGTMSCGMCHVPEQGFAANELATAVGIEGKSLRRNAPTLLNVGHLALLFHDGREVTLENQLWGPLLAADEMGNLTREAVVTHVQALPEYGPQFARAFPARGITASTVESALAAYERTLDSGNSRFDRFFFGHESTALSAQERSGLEVFRNKGRCAACHAIGRHDALFTDQGFHNTGVGAAKANYAPKRVRVPLAPGIETELDVADMPGVFSPEPADLGRFEVTHEERHRFAYKTPSLRNVALTAPYMHDGSVATLEAVIEFYDRGGIDNPGKDPLLAPLGLTAEEKRALVAFLHTLTGDNVEQLAARARAAASTFRFR